MTQEQIVTKSTKSQLPEDNRSRFIKGAGTVLAISYPLLAISTFFRATYQLFLKENVTSYVGPSLSLIASMCYMVAAIGFAVRRKWAWYLSVSVLGFETLMTLIVGTLSILYPQEIGSTVWRYFGIDYAFFPLFQPLIGLVWLLHPETLIAYGIRQPKSETAS